MGVFPFLLASLSLLSAPLQDRSGPKLKPMPLGRSMFVAVPVADRIYCIGGNGPGAEILSVVHEYDVARNTWTEKARWPTPSAYPCGASAGGKVYIIGAPTGEKHRISVVECYDPSKDTWERLPDLPVARSHSVAVAVGDVIYVIGGHGLGNNQDYSSPGKDLDDVWLLDARTRRWSPGPRLPQPVHGMAAAVVEGNVHVFGGLKTEQQHLVLDGGQWRKRADVPFGVVKMAATGIKGKAIVVGGGEHESEVAVYDAKAGQWTLSGKTSVGRFLAQTVTVNGTAYVLGGVVHQPRSGVQRKVERYDVEKNQWWD